MKYVLVWFQNKYKGSKKIYELILHLIALGLIVTDFNRGIDTE